MPNCKAKKSAISLQSFAKGCIVCSGIIFFFAPASVNSPALCAGAGIAQKRQKNAEGLGRRSAFFGEERTLSVPPYGICVFGSGIN